MARAYHSSSLSRKAAGMERLTWDINNAAGDGVLVGLAVGDVLMVVVIIWELWF